MAGLKNNPEAVDTSTSKMKVKPTAEELAIAREAYGKAKNDTQQNLSDLNKEINKVKVKDGIRNFTEALNSKPEYKKQVEQILGLPWDGSSDSSQLKKDITALQKKLELPIKEQDGALGPKTFNALEKAWKVSQAQDPKPNYKTFIDGLIRLPATTPEPQVSTQPIQWTMETTTEVDPKTLLSVKDNKVMLGNDSFDFELKGDWTTLGIDRDAYEISDVWQEYNLKINTMNDSVKINKDVLFAVINNHDPVINGITVNSKEPVKIIINKTEGKKEAPKKEDTVADRSANTPTTTENERQSGINITMWNVTLDNQNQLQTTMDVRSPLEQSLADTPLPEELQVDQSVAPNLQAQIAIQPVVEALKS